MDNSYFTQVAPYFQQQDQGLAPVFQNIAQQQQNQNAALAQQNQQIQPPNQSQGGMNPMAMAMALRGKQPQTGADAAKMNEAGAYMPWNQMSASSQYGTNPYSQQSLMLASQDLGMK